MKKVFFILLLIYMTPLAAQTQQDDAAPIDSVNKPGWLERYRLKNAEKAKKGEFMITPMAGPGYTPELGFSLAGGALMSFKTNKSDSLLQRSSIPMTVGISSTGAVFVSSKATTFWLQDRLRVNADIWFKHMPDNYFGVGYDKNSTIPKSDSTTQYDRLWFQINPQVFWEIKENYFIGGALDINYTKGKNPATLVADDPNYTAYNDRPFNAGLGLHAMIDSRDIPVNAWKGWYLLAQAMIYGHYLGGQNNYQVFNVDVRHYIQLFKPGQTLALQIRGRAATDQVPYGEMSQLGTPFDLRGYLWGQYRDKCMLFGIAEYRHSFYKRDGKRSPHGLVGWIAGGSIAPDLGFHDWLPNGGIGYRFEVQPRMAVRLDMGFGKNSRGFYFNFNEAF